MPNQKIQKVVGIFILCFLALGCTHIVNPESPIHKPLLVQVIPLTVGVFYPEELQNYECETGKGYLFDKFVIRLGQASVTVYDLVFSSLFKKTFRISKDRPSTQEEQNADIVELTITDFTGCEARWPIIGTTSLVITYKAILRTSTGNKIAEWIGTGPTIPEEGADHNEGFDPEKNYLKQLTELAIRRATADFVKNFEGNPEVKAWLESRGFSRLN